jgi:fucose 4-O-acetylase-like acetyltransferase
MKKLRWVDVVKGFAIIAVVAWHTNFNVNSIFPYSQGGAFLPLKQMLGTFWHVPVFLCIGGFFLREEELIHPKKFVAKKWKQLYVKLLIFYAAFILLHNVFFQIGFYSEEAFYHGKHIAPLHSIKDYIIACMWGLAAAREPFLGAMWFVNLLFLGLCIISFVFFVLSKTKWKNDEVARATVLLMLFFTSSLFSHILGISITRITPAMCGAWLIYCGFVANKKYKISYDNGFVFMASLLLMYEMCSIYGEVSLSEDIYADCTVLTLGTLCSLYVLCYIAKKIENTKIGDFFAMCGRESYYIMALHLLGFKVGTMLLSTFGYEKPWDELFSQADNLFEWILYIITSVLFSLFVAYIIKFIKNISNNVSVTK